MYLYFNRFSVNVTPTHHSCDYFFPFFRRVTISFLSSVTLPLKTCLEKTSFSCIIRFYLFTCLKLVEKKHAFKVMGKCDFQALAVHVYGWSSRRERRCCCFSCWFLPAAGEERGGPRGTKPRETSGYLLRGCFPPQL